MGHIKIYGASDDLIEIEGIISDEYGCYDAGQMTVIASDGTEAFIEYNGDWHIKIYKQGKGFVGLIPSVGEGREHKTELAKGCTSYSDVLILNSKFVEWVKVDGVKFTKHGSN